MTDPAGNVGTAAQTLTITAAATGTTGATGPKSNTGGSGLAFSSANYKIKHGRRVQIRFVLSARAKLTMTVTQSKKVIARMTVTRTKLGRASLIWNGKIRRGYAPPEAPTRSW